MTRRPRIIGILLLAALCFGALVGRAQDAHSRAVVVVTRTPAAYGAAQYVTAGMPFLEHEGTTILLCTSSVSGHTMPPFLSPAAVATP